MKTYTKRNLFFVFLSLSLIVSACGNLLNSSTCSVNSAKCTGCGNCLSACSHGAISLSGGKATINSGKCVGCGKCISRCSNKAISFD